MFQTKVVEKIKTHIYVQKRFLFFENHALFETLWKNMFKPGGGGGGQRMTI